MAMLAGTAYDPAVAVTKTNGSLLAMTAIDTTNLRLTFTAPANGAVLVRMRTLLSGTAGTAMILLGVLDGATVRGRVAPWPIRPQNSTGTAMQGKEVSYVVPGLTPGQSYTWDAAYAVQVTNASSPIKYGGPDNNTTNNAWGAFEYSIWETGSLLASTLYDPLTPASVPADTLIAMTALDTTNLRLTFTAPASGRVLGRLGVVSTGATGSAPVFLVGALDGATVRARTFAGVFSLQFGVAAATDLNSVGGTFLVTGLTPGNSYTWDAAYSVKASALASSVLKWGGPNDASGADAWGGAIYEIWSV